MALFITGLILITIYGVALISSRFLGFPLFYDMLTQLSLALGLGADFLMRLLPLTGAILMIIGNRQMLMATVTCDQCGWQGPKRQFTRGCAECGSKQWH